MSEVAKKKKIVVAKIGFVMSAGPRNKNKSWSGLTLKIIRHLLQCNSKQGVKVTENS